MAGFDSAWDAVRSDHQGEKVSPELKKLLETVYASLNTLQPDLKVLKHGLEDLLKYLATTGRTNANCWAVDLFFCNSEGWERDWAEQELPDDYHDLLAMLGEALHDTVANPSVAENFNCLPEQLLKRIQQLG
jgi:hypothetical protein